jgi:1,4-alpha-glucan branching enzyme
MLGNDDLYLFNEGRHVRLYQKLGAHLGHREGEPGAWFAVWAPNAASVSVMGDFNGWSNAGNPLTPRSGSGLFEGFVPGAQKGQRYVFHVVSRNEGYRIDKADPFAVHAQVPPERASVLWDLDYEWGDAAWIDARREQHRAGALRGPMSIYEVHLGSWRRVPDESGTWQRSLSYRELADSLPQYVRELGFTHVELLPVMEHPFYGSWGYQVTGYFAPTSRYGTPQDLMYLIDTLHRHGIGVILDWVPSHFPSDGHGLSYFDGTHLYEHADPRKGFHPEWNSLIFNYGRNEVRSFLLSSAMSWIDRYHADGLRVDGVASMLYLDYGRKPGEWIPNVHGGRENLDAVHFLRELNQDIRRECPDVVTIAEESTSWPMVTGPVDSGGLGFDLKWDMGWMHDTLKYFSKDPVHRKHHHNQLTFRQMYAHSERFLLSLSHDEVVHMKGSLYGKMAGDPWQKRASLRLLYGYQYALPGKKLLFMGAELGQEREWNHDGSLDWELLDEAPPNRAAEGGAGERVGHRGIFRFLSVLNALYQREPALFARDYEYGGFTWIDPDDSDHSVLSFLRRGDGPADVILIACNFTPVPRAEYRIGVPEIPGASGFWEEILNSDASEYGGCGSGNLGGVHDEEVPHARCSRSIKAFLPPLAVLYFKPRMLTRPEHDADTNAAAKAAGEVKTNRSDA